MPEPVDGQDTPCRSRPPRAPSITPPTPVDYAGKPPAPTPRSRLITLLVILGTLTVVWAVAPDVLIVLIWEGVIAGCGVLAATGLGLWIVRGLGLHHAPARWQLLLAAGLGLGALSLLVLGLGTLGLLHRWLWLSLLTIFAIAGLPRWRDVIAKNPVVTETNDDRADRWMRWLWLGVIGFGALALIVATMPPGILWPAEANGYDVLEYHLGVPREHFEAGRISYLPHNIYSNFPFNVEMLYLLTMVLHGDPIAAVFTAKLLNAYLGMLAVGGMWLAGREFGRGSGIVAGLIGASCPFLTYLCGVAYVENGLLLFAGLALGALLRVCHDRPAVATRWIAASGLLTGLACGCKYTAAPMVLLPLLLAVAWHAARQRPARPRWLLAFLVGGLVAFAPWLAKNAVMTGNPVFPLARNAFPERPGIWNEDGAARWASGHLPAENDRPIRQRFARLWSEVVGAGLFAAADPPDDPAAPVQSKAQGAVLFGPAILLAVFIGAARLFGRRPSTTPGEDTATTTGETPVPQSCHGPINVRQRGTGMCWMMLIVATIAWLGWTHLVGRFAIVIVIPVAVILGCYWNTLRGKMARCLGAAALVAVVGLNLATTIGMFTEFPYVQIRAFGYAGLMTEGIWPVQQHVPLINEKTAAGARVLMVADARHFYLGAGVDYCVVFNPNPFADAAETRSPPELIRWLREQGYGYVYIDWGEMQRLRRSRYGFWKSIDAPLFQHLEKVGLARSQDFSIDEGGPAYGTLFQVPNNGERSQL